MELASNPFAHYMALAEQRRAAKLPWYRRHWLVLLCSTVGMLSFVSMEISMTSYSAATLSEMQEALRLIAAAVIGAVTGGAFGYLVQGIYNAVLGGISLLGIGKSRQINLELDDALLSTTISDIDILVSTLRCIVWPFWKRWAVFVAVTTATVLSSAMVLEYQGAIAIPKLAPALSLIDGGLHGNEYVALLATILPSQLWQICITLVNVVPGFISGLLAALGLVLLMICFGRSIYTQILGPVSAVLTTLAQLFSAYALPVVIYLSSLPYLMGGYVSKAEVVPHEEEQLLLVLMLAGIGTAIAATAIVLSTARRLQSLRPLLAVAVPLTLIAVPLALSLAWMSPVLYQGNAPGLGLGYIGLPYLVNTIWATNVLGMLSNYASVIPLELQQPVFYRYIPVPLVEWLRMPLMLALQVVLVIILSRFALDAVSRRRHAAE